MKTQSKVALTLLFLITWPLFSRVVLAQPAPQQFVIETVGNSANTIPTTDNPYGGDPSCTPSTPCENPLFTTFDTNGAVLAELGGTGSSNVLVATNSNWSLEGGTSITLTNWCSSAPIVTVNDDLQNVVWTFTGTSNPCTSAPISGSYTVANGVPESGTFTISLFADASGSWSGTFDNVSPPSPGHSQGGSGNAPLTIAVHSNFTVDETLTLPSGTLGACQTQTSFSSADPAALNNGVIPGSVAGVASGDILSVAVANSENTLWLNASDIDTNGNKITDGSLFITGFVASGTCSGVFFWDAPFSRTKSLRSPPVRRRMRSLPIREHHAERLRRQDREHVESLRHYREFINQTF